jgi:16S rRNA (cytidine1402-2'-O)-methyltransferase
VRTRYISTVTLHRKGIVAVTTVEAWPAIEQALYVVATPLGNLGDISLRALDVLAQVDLIAAEDTRVTAKLLARHGIAARQLSLHAHNERRRAGEIVALLAAGKSVALVSDAGTPGVSDPGSAIVQAVAAAGYAVVPIPGPSAVIAALSVSGFAAPQWLFCGFLPAAAVARRAAIARLEALPFALVFYEAPHRIAATIDALAAAFGPERRVVVARELTKRFESVFRGRLGEAAAWLAADPHRTRGEFVLVLDAPDAAPDLEGDADAAERTLATLLAELPLAQAVRLAATLTGAPRKRLYARALALTQATRT